MVGLHDLSTRICSGTYVLLDGYNGVVILNPTDQTLWEYGELEEKESEVERRLSELRETYNAAVLEYRRVNHVRSTSHPVPELAAEGEWLEAPLWIWRQEDPRRRRLFVCRQGDRLVLSDRAGWEQAIDSE